MKRKTKLLLTAAASLILAGIAAHGSTGMKYGYDELNRLETVRFGDGTAIIYGYDDLGNRVTRTVQPNQAPNTPADPSYLDATGVSTSPELSWTGGDPLGDAVTYDIYLDTNPQPTTPSSTGQSATSLQIQDLACLTTYYWSVNSTDEYGAVTHGTIWHFTTGRGDPAKNTRTGTKYSTLQAAYNAASDGDTLLSQDVELAENFTAGRDITVTIDGGYDCNFTANPNKTTIVGSPAINNGMVTLKNYIISN